MKKFIIALAIFTAGELSLAIRLNSIANRVAATNGRRPIAVKPEAPLDYLNMKFADVDDDISRSDIPIRLF